jgi:hypothetical protein
VEPQLRVYWREQATLLFSLILSKGAAVRAMGIFS